MKNDLKSNKTKMEEDKKAKELAQKKKEEEQKLAKKKAESKPEPTEKQVARLISEGKSLGEIQHTL